MSGRLKQNKNFPVSLSSYSARGLIAIHPINIIFLFSTIRQLTVQSQWKKCIEISRPPAPVSAHQARAEPPHRSPFECENSQAAEMVECRLADSLPIASAHKDMHRLPSGRQPACRGARSARHPRNSSALQLAPATFLAARCTDVCRWSSALVQKMVRKPYVHHLPDS